MSSSVEQIKEKLDVAEVIGSYIKLEKAGANFKGKCPFHNEKTPSFFVSPERGSYYCFGCGAKGDIFTFVQEFEGLDFVPALKMLADRAGVVLSRDLPERKEEADKARKVLSFAEEWFVENLSRYPEVSEYIRKRGITDETATLWRIGYAPKEWRALVTTAVKEGFSSADLLSVGLVKRSDKAIDGEENHYDVFRDRIMFPIFDSSGKTIAFSGRLFGDDDKSPKYLNSPETKLFKKSETLYGFDRAKNEIRKKDYSILVEGQFDLIMCHQAGFTNAVASSGTAFTREHLERLLRLSRRIMLAFDSDKAGFSAALKSGALALSLGMEVKVVELPKGSDPAELILTDLPSWKDALRSAKHLIDFYLDALVKENQDKRKLLKEIERKVLPYVALLQSSIEQSHFISQIAKKAGVREEAIWTDLRNLPPTRPLQEGSETADPTAEKSQSRREYIGRRVAGIVIWQEGKETPDIDPLTVRSQLIALLGDQGTAELFRLFSERQDEMVFEAEAYYGSSKTLRRDIEELLVNFEEDLLRERFVYAMNELGQAEAAKDEKKSAELLALCQDISNRLAELSKRRFAEDP